MTTTARVIDISPAHLVRTMRASAPAASTASVLDDLADGIEAVHQLANLAGFTERPRQLIFALASRAHKAGESFVELYDAELAEQQNCSTRTVRRQRADYLKESRARRFGFVEVLEGDYNRGTNQNAPTRYRFHVGGQIAAAVELARQSPGWAEMDRRKQVEAIARACEEVFHTIPDARRKKREGRRPRPATAEIESRLKVAETNLDAASEMAAKLSDSARADLVERVELRARLYRMRAEIDELLAGGRPQDVDAPEDDGGLGQIVRTPRDVSAPPAATPEPVRISSNIKNTRTLTPPESPPVEHSPESVAAFDALTERLTAPLVQSVELELRGPEEVPQPGEVPEEEEVRERIGVLVESGALSDEDARGWEDAAHDPDLRRAFARRFMWGERPEIE